MKPKEKKAFGPKFKMIYALVQISLFYLLISLFPKYDLIFILAIVITYLIPLYINSYLIKFKDRETRLSTYFIEDTVYYYLPSVILSLLIEVALYFVGIIGDIVGFFTVVLFIVFTLLMLFQWLRYFFQYKMTRCAKKDINVDGKNK